MRVSCSIVWFSLLVFAFAGVPQSRDSGVDEKLCPVHHVPLRKEKLKIVYGLVIDDCNMWDHAKASEKYFPYANSVVYGGCVILPESPKEEEVLYCPKCREVEETWPCVETRDTPIITTLPSPRVTRLPPTRP